MKLYGFLSFMMALIRVKFKSFTKKLTKCFKRNFVKALPRIIKKQTLVVTLYLKGRNEKIFDDVNMRELNIYLDIANDPKVLSYIVDFNEKCDWYNFDFKNLLDKHNCQLDTKVDGSVITQLSKDIVDKTPTWLKYGEQSMIQDISCLLLKIPANRFQQCAVK